MISVLVYCSEFLIIFLGWFFLLRKNSSKRKLIAFYILVLLPMVLISSLKSTSVGNDTSGYYQRYLGFSSKSFGEVVSLTNEPLFFSISWLSSKLKIPWVLFLAGLYSISYFGYGFFLFKKATHPVFSVLFLYCFGVFLFSISGLRQGIAMGISCVGMALFNKASLKQWLVFLCFLFIAFCFHKASLISILYPLMFLIKANKRNFFLICFLLLIFGALSYGLIDYLCFDLKILEYGAQFTTSYWNFFFALVLFGISASLLFSPKTSYLFVGKTNKTDVFLSRGVLGVMEGDKTSLELNFFGGMPYLAMLVLGIWSSTISRLFLYFSMPAILVLGESLSLFKSKTTRFVVFAAFSILFVFYFVYQCFYHHYLSTYPFQFFNG
jgi:hypothetical protein